MPAEPPPGPADPAAVVRLLAGCGRTLATAESLTAGLLAARIAEVPGASAVLRGGLVVYATDLKERLAGVPRGILAAHGAVSPETARALAEGARARCAADWGVGLTGVAGPEPQEGRPVGEVWCAVAGPGGTRVADLALDPGLGRAGIRRAAVAGALAMLAAAAGEDPGCAEQNGSPGRCTP